MVEENPSLQKICNCNMDTPYLFTELQQNEIELKFREAENKESRYKTINAKLAF